MVHRVTEVRHDREFVGAFRQGELDAMHSTILTLRNRVLATRPLNLMPQDILDLFVPVRLHERCIEAPHQFGLDPTEHLEWRFPEHRGVVLDFYINHPDPCFWTLPVEAMMVLNKEAAAYQKVSDWIKWRCAVGEQWGLVGAVVDYLNDTVATPLLAQYRFGAIGTLLRKSGNAMAQLLGERLAKGKLPDSIPRCPLVMKQVFATAQATVATGLLMPNLDTKSNRAITVSLDLREGYTTGPLPWGGGFIPPC